MTRRGADRLARDAITQLLRYYASSGLIRSFAVHDDGTYWRVVLNTGPDVALTTLPQAQIFCAALASAAMAIKNREGSLRA